jgi:hypothetical protein
MCGGLSYPQARLTTETAWKAGESELICLHGGLRLCRLISAEWRKTLGLIFEIFTEKKKISFPFK